MSDVDDFERLAAALRPWLNDLVVVGGWAHRMHHQHPLAQPPGYAVVRTRDADLAFGARTTLRGRLDEALKTAGFREELSTEETPPVAQYFLGSGDEGFYAEFISPLPGSATRRDGSPDATVARGGVMAQRLRHVDLLLVDPWRLALGGPESEHLNTPVNVLVANPVTFVVQKLLIHGDRRPQKRPQDILYIHDTLQLFGSSLDALAKLWTERISGALTARQLKDVARARERIFATVTDDIRSAARIPVDRALLPEDIREACLRGLDVVLG